MKRLLFSFCAASVLVIVAYFYVDRSLVDLLLRHHSPDFALIPKVFDGMYAIILGGALLAYLQCGVAVLYRRGDWLQPVCYLPAVAVSVAYLLKDLLKYGAGRAWPLTFMCQNPSYLHDGVYGFLGPTPGMINASFPSGHAMVAAAAMTVFAILYPKFKVIFASIALCIGLSMVWMLYHFLSDVLAGWYMGVVIGYSVASVNSRKGWKDV